jgi:hypothetical protein
MVAGVSDFPRHIFKRNDLSRRIGPGGGAKRGICAVLKDLDLAGIPCFLD